MGQKVVKLVALSEARRLLAEASTVEQVKDVRNRAQALRAYVQKAQLGQQIEVEVAVLRLRAERKLGKVLLRLPLAKAASGNQYTGRLDRDQGNSGPIFLRDLGITHADSSRAQRVASLPDQVFENFLKIQSNTGKPPTIAAVLRLVRGNPKPAAPVTDSAPPVVPAKAVDAMSVRDSADAMTIRELVGSKTFSTICAAPPWPTPGTMRLQVVKRILNEFLQLPVSDLANEAAHLHLLTSNTYLRIALQLLEAWGFVYASTLVLQRSGVSPAPYWQDNHQLLVLGVRGNLKFQDKSRPSCQSIEEDFCQGIPRSLRLLLENVSPGPYLELFCRDSTPQRGWTRCQ